VDILAQRAEGGLHARCDCRRGLSRSVQRLQRRNIGDARRALDLFQEFSVELADRDESMQLPKAHVKQGPSQDRDGQHDRVHSDPAYAEQN